MSAHDHAQDAVLLAIADGRPIPLDRLRSLPPWRALLVARVALRAGALSADVVEDLRKEARLVGGTGRLSPVSPDPVSPDGPRTEPSRVEAAVARLRDAADALEAVPFVFRREGPGLVISSVTPATLRAKADSIEQAGQEARAALERTEEPF